MRKEDGEKALEGADKEWHKIAPQEVTQRILSEAEVFFESMEGTQERKAVGEKWTKRLIREGEGNT